MRKDAILLPVSVIFIALLLGCTGNKDSDEGSSPQITETTEQNRSVGIEELYRNAPANSTAQEDWSQWESKYGGKHVGGKGRVDSVSIHPLEGKLFLIVTISGKEGTIENGTTQIALLVENAHEIALGEEEGSFLVDGIKWIYLGDNYAFEGIVSTFSLFDSELVRSGYRNLVIIQGKMKDIVKE